MPLELDHAFITCAPGAPEAAALLRLGVIEGSGNTHPGQGTANRRFFFENFMLELLWVNDQAQAQSELTRPTRLWDRFAGRAAGVNPFGIIFRSSDAPPAPAPFPTWVYRPMYLPSDLSMQVAAGTTLDEPELFYLPFLHRRSVVGTEPVAHQKPIHAITGLAASVPSLAGLSSASRCAEEAGSLSYFESPRPLLKIFFDGPPDLHYDLRPDLPLIFSSTPQADRS
jgi:hypothetical protein